MFSLSSLIEVFPTLHRSLTTQIISATTKFLSDTQTSTHSSQLVQVAAHLLASVHFIDGKVGAPLAWRNVLDCALNESWNCVASLQSTLNTGEQNLPHFIVIYSFANISVQSRFPLSV